VRSERGQAALEWVGLVLLVALVSGAAITVAPTVFDGRPLGAELARALVCAVRGGCDDGDDALVDAYGERDAALVREYLPNLVYEPRSRTLPVDFRRCRSHECSDAPDEEGLDVHRARKGRGTQATVFTHIVRDGGETFLQYWLYYPDSTSTWMGSAGLWNKVVKPVTGKDYPGFHPDDWESVQVRIDDATGAARVRASSHREYRGCKECPDEWARWGGWSRVSYGSHAGHIPQPRDSDERTTTAAGVRVVPIETLSARDRATAFEVTPPWEKEVYADPRSDSTG